MFKLSDSRKLCYSLCTTAKSWRYHYESGTITNIRCSTVSFIDMVRMPTTITCRRWFDGREKVVKRSCRPARRHSIIMGRTRRAGSWLVYCRLHARVVWVTSLRSTWLVIVPLLPSITLPRTTESCRGVYPPKADDTAPQFTFPISPFSLSLPFLSICYRSLSLPSLFPSPKSS